MTQLNILITNLERAIADKTDYIRSIRDPPMLLKVLKELRNMIGNDTIKDSIASQVSYLITMRSKKESDTMLNTILYGPPGTGKTTIGIKLAKIWHALGYIKKRTVSGTKRVATVTSKVRHADVETWCLWITLMFLGWSLFSPAIKAVHGWVGPMYFWIGAGAVLLFLLVFTVAYQNAPQEEVVVMKEDQESDSDLITITSREDFVDKYVGWTDKKTKALLEANVGKVLFIDEAYSLITGHNDPYGREALNTINRFLSENPGKIVVIMAGYKQLLQQGPFAIQPGLPRRFMWHFECDGYSPEELYDIFLLQLKKKGWTIKDGDKERVKTLFKSNTTAMPSFGGDAERLCFFSQLEYSKDIVGGGATVADELTYEQIKRGFIVLKANNIHKDTPRDDMEDVKTILDRMGLNRPPPPSVPPQAPKSTIPASIPVSIPVRPEPVSSVPPIPLKVR